MQKKINNLIKDYKEDKSRLMDIIQKMQPLINGYAKRMYNLEYEDMQQEFTIAIIESVIKIKKYDDENQCLAFIKNAVKNRYYELCRKSCLIETEIPYDDEVLEYFATDSKEAFADIEFFADLKVLKKENSSFKNIIAISIVEKDASDQEIAKLLGVSRQYVNRCKKEIFRELKEKSP